MISYGVTVHNESTEYLTPLLDKLLRLKQIDDEIIVLDDFSNEPDTISVLEKYKDIVKIYNHRLDGDFAAHKNYLNSLCKGTHIFQIDADETIHDILLKVLPEVLMMNAGVDMFTLPRINLVVNITPEDIAKWGWNLNDKQWINYPDRQTRIYKNNPTIFWQGKVHERIVGHMSHTDFPESVEYSLLHIKSIERQRSQNELYSKMIS
jgi:glycosyltransferase involved in cell wall biosynthesis